MNKTMIVALSLALTACNSEIVSYENQFGRVAIGATRTEVVAVMGEPTSQYSIELPLVGRGEKMEWTGLSVRPKTYAVVLVADRVVMKKEYR